MTAVFVGGVHRLAPAVDPHRGVALLSGYRDDGIVSKRLSPQEKKLLSYERDRRNHYGENDKASRKLIPARKRRVVRSYRRATKKEIPKNALVRSHDDLVDAETRVLAVRRHWWKKWPDMPLGQFISQRQNMRVQREGRKKQAQAARKNREDA
jgi:hypothetical protein